VIYENEMDVGALCRPPKLTIKLHAAAGAMRTTITTLVFASALALALPLQALGGACEVFDLEDLEVCHETVRFAFNLLVPHRHLHTLVPPFILLFKR
jgi:hypothetical protein